MPYLLPPSRVPINPTLTLALTLTLPFESSIEGSLGFALLRAPALHENGQGRESNHSEGGAPGQVHGAGQGHVTELQEEHIGRMTPVSGALGVVLGVLGVVLGTPEKTVWWGSRHYHRGY